jgi:macrolide transport system ATP-binding/permease protein
LRFVNFGLVFHDLKFASRQVSKNSTISIAIILTLSLGSGANIAIFNLLNAIILKKLPVERADELVRVSLISQQGEDVGFTYDLFNQFHQIQQVFAESYGTSYPENMKLGKDQDSTGVQVQLVSGDYFSVLKATPYLGRFLTGEDDQQNSLVGILSYQMWAKAFNKNPQILGETLYVDRQPITVIGVAPPEFIGDVVGERVDLWLPLGLYSQMYNRMMVSGNSSSLAFIYVIGRLRTDIEKVKAGLEVTMGRLHENAKGAQTRSFIESA